MAEVGWLSQLDEHEVILGVAVTVVPVADNTDRVKGLLCPISDSDPEISQHHFQISGGRGVGSNHYHHHLCRRPGRHQRLY